ncbi:MAG TPA: DUF998 domain-containing protein [Candidatus Angelobacter sp.]
MNQQSGPQDPVVISYLALRKAVGIIGFALPVVLAVGKILFESPGIQSSISRYYYTDLRDVFVGSLCAIGIFLMSTKGYDKRDKIAGSAASVFAIGVAMFPTTPDGAPASLIGALHLTFATLLFLTFAYFCFKLFALTSGNPTRRKIQRNAVYRVCGSIILACIALIALSALPPVKQMVEPLKPVFWLEAAAVMTFGVAWLTKGEAILKDEQRAAKSANAG